MAQRRLSTSDLALTTAMNRLLLVSGGASLLTATPHDAAATAAAATSDPAGSVSSRRPAARGRLALLMRGAPRCAPTPARARALAAAVAVALLLAALAPLVSAYVIDCPWATNESRAWCLASLLGPLGWWPLWGPPAARGAWACHDCGCPGFDSDAAAEAAGCLPSRRLRALAERDNWPALAHPRLWPRLHEEHMPSGRCFALGARTGAVANASSAEAAEVAAAGGAYLQPPAPPPPPLQRAEPAPPAEPAAPAILFHVYVRMDLEPLGRWHAATLAGVLATQPAASAVLVVWSPHASIGRHPVVRAFTAAFPGRVFYRVFDAAREAVGTPLEGTPLVGRTDGQGWMDSDAMRLVALYHYGGVYLDTDLLLHRDVSPLLGHEWATEFGCDHPTRFNNAAMRFRARSAGIAALCARAGVLPLQPGSWAYGPELLERVDGKWLWWRRRALFLQTPWCFFHGRWCGDGVSVEQQAGAAPVAPAHEAGMFGLHYHGITRQREPAAGSLLHRWEREHARALDAQLGARAGGGGGGGGGGAQDGGGGGAQGGGVWRRTLEAALREAAHFKHSAG